MRAIRTALQFALLLSAAAAAGCNTFEGFGRDLESVGNSIKDLADGGSK
jgi:predicted small secreted protein